MQNEETTTELFVFDYLEDSEIEDAEVVGCSYDIVVF